MQSAIIYKYSHSTQYPEKMNLEYEVAFVTDTNLLRIQCKWETRELYGNDDFTTRDALAIETAIIECASYCFVRIHEGFTESCRIAYLNDTKKRQSFSETSKRLFYLPSTMTLEFAIILHAIANA
jgi:hypothetical protein